MAKDWLPGFERLGSPAAAGGTYVDGVPWRFVGHTTEAVPSSIGGARTMAQAHPNPPQLWCWPEENWCAQTIPLSRSGRALLHKAGTPETNKMRAIQCEVIGRAAEMPSKPDSFWEWLGENVLRPVIDAGYPINLDNVAPTTGGDGYGAAGAVRMTAKQWREFDGVCVHANVPTNEHWDMGKANIRRMADAAKTGGDDMFENADKARLEKVEELLELLVPRLPLHALTSGDDVGKVVPAGTAGSKPVADIWRYGVYLELERQGKTNFLVDRVAAAVVAALPPGQGGSAPTLAEIQAAVKVVVNQELGFLKPGV